MVKTMTEAAHIPTFGYNDEIDMTRLVELRRDIKGVTESAGVRFSYMPIIVKVWKIFITSLLKGYHSHRENLLLSNMPIFVKVERIYIIVGRNISLFSFFNMTIIQKLSHSLK